MSGTSEIRETLDRIADSLERIEKALPGCNQEALEESVKQVLTSLLTYERTHAEYK